MNPFHLFIKCWIHYYKYENEGSYHELCSNQTYLAQQEEFKGVVVEWSILSSFPLPFSIVSNLIGNAFGIMPMLTISISFDFVSYVIGIIAFQNGSYKGMLVYRAIAGFAKGTYFVCVPIVIKKITKHLAIRSIGTVLYQLCKNILPIFESRLKMPS